ncbi:MarP family serine protease [Acidipropionibacterium virtanenii]|uniref:Serine protease n=1 Tax=Acidipropionibacterium virtanenii TaxID=2057246 RepID=A0A344UQG2_9ACTN|nr:MarP family serine protease [Acidipropionibacterium virtanenii]AXE37510.1 Serine protease [Acidipropionibacterium virtanenii]
MTGSVILDVVLVLLLIGQARRGWRRGAVVGVLSLAGLILGAWFGLWLAGSVGDWMSNGTDLSALWTGIARIALFIITAEAGESILSGIGMRLRGANRIPTLRTADSLIGSVVSVVVAALVLTVAAGAVRPLLPSAWSQTVAGSKVLATVDRAVPDPVNRAANRLAGALADGFPRVFSGLDVEPDLPARSPDQSVTQTAAVQQAGAGIVKVRSTATQCSRASEGTGWVSATNRVVTNAHVVAGASNVSVETQSGRTVRAIVVSYDPDLDLAVLRVPDLGLTPLQMVASASAGDQTIVAGYPLDGPYTLRAATVRGTIEARGENIYATRTVVREVMAVRGTVQPGNSGGPLLTTDGKVAGTVFARSTSASDTGYVLTNSATRAMIAAGSSDTTAASTQVCTTD